LNPIFIREIRQFVRSKFIIVLINIYVIALAAACFAALLPTMYMEILMGGYLLFFLGNIIFVTSLIVIIMRTIWIMTSDKMNEDLMFFSSMTPSAIVFGKMFSGAVFTVLLMSMTAPFVTIAYLARGIDLTLIINHFVIIFWVIQILNSFAIFISTKPPKKYQYLTSSIFIPFFLYFPAISLIYQLSMLTTLHLLIISFGACGLLALLICSSISALSPPNSNRLFPLRILLPIIFLLTVVINTGFSYFTTAVPANFYPFVENIALFVMIFMIMKVISEPDQWSIRIRQSLPKSLLKRIFLFPFYTGSPCGIVWVLMMVLLICVCEKILMYNINDSKLFIIQYSNNQITVPLFTGLFVFIFNYSITALLMRCWIFKKFTAVHITNSILLSLLLILTLGSFLIYAGLELLKNPIEQINSSDYENSILSLLNPFCNLILYQGYTGMRLAGMISWLMVILILLGRWYNQRIRNFSSDFKEPLSYEEARNFVLEIENKKYIKNLQNDT
jgi:hypothetical protein